jgi:hypothetical protein
MSKIEVDAIDKQSGSTLTLGGSGTAVTLAAGATQSGFGRTGTVDWQTGSIKTATFTAANGEGYFCNTAGGSFEVDLPAGSAGAIVSIQDYNNTFDSNRLTVDPNGSEKINGGAAGEPVQLETEGQGVTFIYIDSTVGWRSVQDNQFSQVGVAPAYVTATGGTITTVGDFKVHVFTGPGTFCVSNGGNAGGSNKVDYMVIAGGGGGGGDQSNGYGAGGGGAGGYRESGGTSSGSYTIGLPANSCVSALPIAAGGYPITVGSGGAKGTSGLNGPDASNGSRGANSIFNTITSTGGGGGAFGGSPAPAFSVVPGGVGPGGSGGGGAGPAPTATGLGTGNTPSVTPAQGSDGGAARTPSTPNYGGGGGGGASAAGQPFTDAAPGPNAADGGAGATSNITNTPTARGGGGGGGAYYSGPASFPNRPGGTNAFGGGTGGHDNPAGSAAATAGTVNTGGGGGGAASRYPGSPGSVDAGNGGSGVVIVRYKFQN